MRILTLTTLFPSSVDPVQGIFVYQRISTFAEVTDTEVEAISPVPFVPRWVKSPRWSKYSRTPKSEFIGNIPVHHPRYLLVPKVSMPAHGVLMYLGLRRAALQLHQAKPFDCIDAHYVYPDGFAAVMLGRLLRIPVVISARGTDINLFPAFRTIRPLIRWTLRQCQGIISVSSALKDIIVELRVPANKIAVIGNGVDIDRFRVMEREEARGRLKIKAVGPILVCVASLRESKGQQHLIAAIGKVAAQHSGLKLYLIGEGPNRTNLELLRDRLGLQGQVVFAGSRSNNEIPLWFNAADISLLASSSEGWPNVILESLACGTPVIATRVGQIPEILSSGDLGILVDRSVDSLSSAIKSGLARSWDRMALQNFAYSRPWSKVAQEIDQYLTQVVSSSPAITAKAVLAP